MGGKPQQIPKEFWWEEAGITPPPPPLNPLQPGPRLLGGSLELGTPKSLFSSLPPGIFWNGGTGMRMGNLGGFWLFQPLFLLEIHRLKIGRILGGFDLFGGFLGFGWIFFRSLFFFPILFGGFLVPFGLFLISPFILGNFLSF